MVVERQMIGDKITIANIIIEVCLTIIKVCGVGNLVVDAAYPG